MQHDQAAGLQNDKIQPGGEQKWPLYLKIAKAIKSFSSELHGIYGWNSVWSISGTLVFFQNYQHKKTVAELGHSDLLPVYKLCLPKSQYLIKC